MDAATATRVVMGADVSDDGQIFVPNMQSGSSTLSPFKVYKWTGEGDTIAPTAAFSQINPATTNGGFRFGDTFAVRGSDPLPVSVPMLMRELGNSPRGVSRKPLRTPGPLLPRLTSRSSAERPLRKCH